MVRHDFKKIETKIDILLNISQVISFLVLAILILRVISSKELVIFTTRHVAIMFIFLIPLIPFVMQLSSINKFLVQKIVNGLYYFIVTCFLFFEYNSEFKVLLIMPIIIEALKYGTRSAFITSGYSIIILFLTGFKQDFIYIDFDILLSGIFLLVAWLLGNLTEAEKANKQELEYLATFDGLTDLYNHRSFQIILDEEIDKAKENNYSISLLLLDIDYFKIYNDSFGHLKGDLVLKEIGQILKKTFDEIGYAARYGGEEFVIILPDINVDKATIMAEDIRKQIAQSNFYGADILPNGKLTVSIGIASFPLMADNKEKLVQKADEALYKAKYIGKNKVETYYSVFDELSSSLMDEEREIFNYIRTLTMIINAKDKYTYGHSERTMEIVKKMAIRKGLNEQFTKELIYGALLHDIGKIEIPREVLNKSTKLNEDEWNLFKQHPKWGADIIRPLTSLRGAMNIVMCHHENYDGTGYPLGLQGEAIPYGARLLRIVDSYDAMITNRPYKEAMSSEQAIEELKNYSGKYYDPEILKEFLEMLINDKELSETVE